MKHQHPKLSREETAATLAAWVAQAAEVERQMHAGGGKAGLATPEQVQGKTGLELMQNMLAGLIPYPPIAQTLDFMLVEVAPGRAVFQGSPGFKHYNPLGTVHGGWYATLLDSAVGCAVHTLMSPGWGYTTVELGINLVSAASERSGPLRAIGEVVHVGKRLATAEGRILGPDGKLYAHATTTCMVFAPQGSAE